MRCLHYGAPDNRKNKDLLDLASLRLFWGRFLGRFPRSIPRHSPEIRFIGGGYPIKPKLISSLCILKFKTRPLRTVSGAIPAIKVRKVTAPQNSIQGGRLRAFIAQNGAGFYDCFDVTITP
jgi:hypothetical protein